MGTILNRPDQQELEIIQRKIMTQIHLDCAFISRLSIMEISVEQERCLNELDLLPLLATIRLPYPNRTHLDLSIPDPKILFVS